MSEKRLQKINERIQSDPFARFLGATVEILKPGHSRVTLTITDEMMNFHGDTHGGVIFSLGAMAFAAAANSHGQKAVGLNVGINFLKPAKSGDRLVAEAAERTASGPVALYDITVRDDQGDLIAQSQNLAYLKKEWFVPHDESI